MADGFENRPLVPGWLREHWAKDNTQEEDRLGHDPKTHCMNDRLTLSNSNWESKPPPGFLAPLRRRCAGVNFAHCGGTMSNFGVHCNRFRRADRIASKRTSPKATWPRSGGTTSQ